MKHRLLVIGLVFGATLLVFAVVPTPSLAAPDWNIVVVDDYDQPVQGVTVFEYWQNFAIEKQAHEAKRETDAAGHVTFPAQRAQYSPLRQLVGILRAAVSFNMHGGYDAHSHAHVFALGKGFIGQASLDWRGSPPSVSSRIVVRSAVLPAKTR